MSRRSSLPRPARKPAARSLTGSAANARLPHPSWRVFGETLPSQQPLSAEDFWQKLGF